MGVLDHHDRIGAARHRAAGRDLCRRARQHRPRRRRAAGNHLIIEDQAHRRPLACSGEIGRAHGKAVDIGTVEWRHIDRCHHILRHCAAERIGKLPTLARHGAREQRSLEARNRVLPRQNGQELVLIEVPTVIPGWCASTRPGISRFRVRASARPGMTMLGSITAHLDALIIP
jgi:hypothetical protein